MSGAALVLRWIDGDYAVCRLAGDAVAPAWAAAGSLQAMVRTPEELSLVCDVRVVPEGVEAERGFVCFRVVGQLDFALTGILASLAATLADAGVSLFALSTFDTDYILVRERDRVSATAALESAGHRFERAP